MRQQRPEGHEIGKRCILRLCADRIFKDGQLRATSKRNKTQKEDDIAHGTDVADFRGASPDGAAVALELNERSDNDHPMARTQGSHAGTTGPKVRAAALQLFAKHGFAAVSMRQIAREVGVQAGALYLYTPDKQTLLFELMRDHMVELLQAWHPPGGGPMAELEDFARHHIRFHLDRPELVFIAYMELRNLDAANFLEIEALRSKYEARLEAVLQRGVAEGVFNVADIRLAVMGLISMLTGVTTWFRDDGRLARSDVELIYWDMARRMVRAGGAPPEGHGQGEGSAPPRTP